MKDEDFGEIVAFDFPKYNRSSFNCVESFLDRSLFDHAQKKFRDFLFQACNIHDNGLEAILLEAIYEF